MPMVEALGIKSVQAVHASGKIRLRGLYQQMVMIAHEAVSMDPPAKLANCCGKDSEQGLPVGVIAKDRLPGVTAGSDVIVRAGVFESQRPCHLSHNAAAPPRMTAP